MFKQIPAGDNRERDVCRGCGHIEYENPRVVVGCIPVWEDKVLLCRRAIEPRVGYWTLPAGYMENGESLEEGAARETLEEANAKVKIKSLFLVSNDDKNNLVKMIYAAEMINEDHYPGIESLETKLFTMDEIPWGELAFETSTEALKAWNRDGRRDPYELPWVWNHNEGKGVTP